MSDKIVLGYWAVRGRGQVLRHLLAYTGLQFEQKQYQSYQQYGKDAGSLGNFPNLPYLKDGDFTFTETLGIARYIARRGGKADLLGKSPEDQAKMDNFIYAFDDLFSPLIAMFFNKKVMDVKTGHYYKIKTHLEKFDKYINGKKYVLGYLTIADFFLSQYSYYIQRLYPEEFPKYSNILLVRNNVTNLPEVKAYYQKPNAILTPFLSPKITSIPFYWPGTEPKSSVGAPKTVKPVQPKKVQPKKQQQVVNIQQQNQSESQTQQQHQQHQQHQQQPPTQPQTQQQTQVQQNFDQQVQPYAPENPHRVAIISGSVSGNNPANYFLQVITGIGHPAFQFQWCDISNLQIHNQDLEDGTDSSNYLRGQVYQCEAVLICVAQTHNIVSTVLTNAYNWLAPVIKQKPVALVSIQSSQQQFRKTLDKQGVPYLKGVKLSIPDASNFFDQQGSVSGSNYYRVVNYFNRFAQFIETGS